MLFKSAVEDVRSNTDAVIKAFINQAGVLAAQYAIEKITEPIDNSDVIGRRIQADMAKSVLGMISSRKTDVKLTVDNQRKQKVILMLNPLQLCANIHPPQAIGNHMLLSMM